MTEKILLFSSLFAAGVIVCGMLGCLVQMVGKEKWIRSPLRRLPLSTRIVLLILTVSLTFVVATTNLCTPTWFALTNTAFAAGETNLPVAFARSFLLGHSISNLGIFAFCDAGDSDDDGLDDWQERYNLKTEPTLTDSDGDGLADGVEVTRGTNPRLRDTDGDGYGDAGDHDLCATILWEMDRTEGAHV